MSPRNGAARIKSSCSLNLCFANGFQMAVAAVANSTHPVPGRPTYDWPTGRVRSALLPKKVEDIVRSDSTIGICMVASRQGRVNHAWVDLETGLSPRPWSCRFPFPRTSLPPNPRTSRGKVNRPLDITLLHELTQLVRAPHAVVIAAPDEDRILALQYGTGEYRAGDAVDSPRHEVERLRRQRVLVGNKYVRPAHWGTYRNAEHVAAVGGRRRIEEVVRPPVHIDVGELLYVQLSERVEDALTPDTLVRWRAFVELLEPIAVPGLTAS